MQVILDKMNHDPYCKNTTESYGPLTLLKLIKKTISAHTKDQYCYSTVYNQEVVLYGFNKHNLTNEQYYEQFNTKVDVGEAIGITRQHCVLMEDTVQETFKNSDEIS